MAPVTQPGRVNSSGSAVARRIATGRRAVLAVRTTPRLSISASAAPESVPARRFAPGVSSRPGVCHKDPTRAPKPFCRRPSRRSWLQILSSGQCCSPCRSVSGTSSSPGCQSGCNAPPTPQLRSRSAPASSSWREACSAAVAPLPDKVTSKFGVTALIRPRVGLRKPRHRASPGQAATTPRIEEEDREPRS